MNFKLIVKPEAEADLEKAAVWYSNQRHGLGGEFLSAARGTIQRIRRNPKVYAEVSGRIRAARLRRFLYVIYFELDKEQIVVLGVFHGRRDPETWQSRVDNGG